MNKQTSAFYLEALLLTAVLAGVILAVTGVFGAARTRSAQAARLTAAVNLAENAAEAVASSSSLTDVQALLGGSVEGDTLTLAQGELTVTLTWQPQDKLVYSEINVWYDTQRVYTLNTAVAVQEVAG